MPNYDNKLGEWFKQLDAVEQELKSKKNPPANGQTEEEPAPAQPPERQVSSAEISTPVREAPASVVATIESLATDQVVAPAQPAEPPSTEAEQPEAPAAEPAPPPPIFDESDVEQVEDFLAFLGRPRHQDQAPQEHEEPVLFDLPRDQSISNLAEGTGEPRPIASVPPPPPPAPPSPQLLQPAPAPAVEVPHVAKEPTPVQPQSTPQPARPVAQQGWDRMPRHLQLLFGSPGEEVAQRSYKTFRENRGEMIERLLDPSLTLEEAARVLNVCPTTVRRYTNRGMLKHYRTAGNQRRFRLSDVLGFMDGARQQETAGSQDQ